MFKKNDSGERVVDAVFVQTELNVISRFKEKLT